MGLFTLPPKREPTVDKELHLFKPNPNSAPIARCKRTLAAEWAPQSGVQLTWPHEATDWAEMLEEVTACYLRMAYEIALRQKLLIVTPHVATVRALLEEQFPQKLLENIRYFECPTNDTWARDHGFLSLYHEGGIELADFRFNGWGGKFPAEKDNAINAALAQSEWLKGQYMDCLHYELEGGSVESDGCGTILTTAVCLLNPNRNGGATKADTEAALQTYLGAERILWLHHGELAGDDTDGHVDTLARFCPNEQIAYVQCEDTTDEHYPALHAMEQELKTFRTLEGKPYTLVPLPLPAPIYDEDGERLPATYANFLIMDRAVLLPVYNQPDNDRKAHAALAKAFPGYEIVDIDCCALIRQHGSLHCATMQFPRGVLL